VREDTASASGKGLHGSPDVSSTLNCEIVLVFFFENASHLPAVDKALRSSSLSATVPLLVRLDARLCVLPRRLL